MKYTIKKACFACTTPYQVIGAISIVKSEHLQADIYIFGTFPDHDLLSARLRELNIFQNVYAVDSEKINLLGKGQASVEIQTQALFQVAFPQIYVREFLRDDTAYETFYSSSRAHTKLLLQRVLKKRNPEMKTVIYDDGLGSYLEDSHVLRPSKMRRRAEKILGWNLFDPKTVSIQLYLPEIAHIPQELKDCQLREMARLDWQAPENKVILKRLFGISETEKYRERVILFDNVRGATSRREMFEKVDRCYQTILDVVGEKNVLFKAHPRSYEKPSLMLHCIEKQATSMEVFYADMEDLESRVLIAYNSTATYTPKLLFGKEPWVINLHRIVGPPLQKNSEILYQTFLPTYQNKEKLLAPNDMDELKKMLAYALERN